MQAQERIEQYKKIHGKAPGALWLANTAKISHDDAERLLSHTIPEMPRIKNDNGKLLANKATDNQKIDRVARSTDRPSVDSDTKAGNTAPIILPPYTLREKAQALLMAALPFIFFAAAVTGAYRSFGLCYGYFSRSNTADASITMSIMLVALAFAGTKALTILWESVKKGKRIFVFIITGIVTLGTLGVNVFIGASELANQKIDSRTASRQEQNQALQLNSSLNDKLKSKSLLEENLSLDISERQTLINRQNDINNHIKILQQYTDDISIKQVKQLKIEYSTLKKDLDKIKERIDNTGENIKITDVEISAIREKLILIPQDSTVQSTAVDTFINWASAMLVEIGGPIALLLSMSL